MTFLRMSGFVMAAWAFAAAQPARAGILAQAPGTDFLAFEAEDVDSFSNVDDATGWAVVDTIDPIMTAFGSTVLAADTTASRQAALYDQSGGGDQDFVTYQLQFAEPGTYSLYMRYTMFEDNNPDGYGNEDSIYTPTDFGVNPQGDWTNPDNNRTDIPSRGGVPGDGRWEGNFDWWRVTGTNLEGGSNDPVTYDPTVGSVLDFSIAARERGVAIDKFVMSTNDSLSNAELDALPTFVDRPGDPGDFDQNGTVDMADFALLRDNLNDRFSLAESFGKGDNNRDGLVDLHDFIEFRAIFNGEAGSAAVPEPAAIVLVCLAALGALPWVRRRK